MNVVAFYALGALLAHDAFWLADRLGDRTLDRLAAAWHREADRRGWRRPPS